MSCFAHTDKKDAVYIFIIQKDNLLKTC